MSTQVKTNNVTTRAKIQAFGGFLTNMVIPNIGAFIAWGIVTALFIPTGWIPNKYFGELVGPTIKFLLPLLLAHTGGKMVGGHRGAVLGTIGTVGLIIGSEIPMFLGAMIVGPLGGWIMKKFDELVEDKIPAGFEMIVNNFSVGILGFALMMLAYAVIGPTIEAANQAVTTGIEALVRTGMVPLLSIINEPAKVLFLNNVIDQGIYYPLGMQQTLEHGKSIYFMVASNPGTGLGLLLAFTFFGKKTARQTAPGAIIIHFFGGIHELYYPYVFMKPLTIIAMILGGMSGTFTFKLFNAGLVAGPSPGSIFAYLALTPKGNFVGVIAGVAVACLVSFLITAIILKADKSEEDDFEASQQKSMSLKQEGKDILSATSAGTVLASNTKSVSDMDGNSISLIAFACDAGMGSSAMGATRFRKRLKDAGYDNIEVKHYNIESVPENADVVVVHKDLVDRLKKTKNVKRIVPITNYLKDENTDELYDSIVNK